jgi:hypothetical protein
VRGHRCGTGSGILVLWGRRDDESEAQKTDYHGCERAAAQFS